MSERPAASRRLLGLLGTILVTALSVLLLCYVAYGEARRTYPTFQVDRLAAQAELVGHSMESFLLAGLPLEQFPGFVPVTKPLLDSDASIVAVYVTDERDEVVFLHAQPGASGLEAANTLVFQESSLQPPGQRRRVTENASFYRVTLPLSSKFGVVGNLHILMDRSVVTASIDGRFSVVGLIAVLLLAGFTAGAFLTSGRRAATRWMTALYGVTLVAVAAVAIGGMVNLYSEGIEGKTSALARSLGERLKAPFELGLGLSDLSGLDAALRQYKELNPDISFVALTTGGKIAIHTDKQRVGADWQAPADHFEYAVALDGPGGETVIRVGIPTSLVTSKLWRSAKNFLVLFLASGLLSLLFFDLTRTLARGREAAVDSTAAAAASVGRSSANLLRLFYFLDVFIEGLSTSFLPVHFERLARSAGFDKSAVSPLFSVYFLAFLVALLPAGRLAERRGTRPLLIGGGGLVVANLLLMAFVPDFTVMFLARALAGLGQGMLLIGVQSYFLDSASGERRTQGAAIIVFGYNGGLISGTAIGALLAAYMGVQGVFIVGMVAALGLLWYAVTLVPTARPSAARIADGHGPEEGFFTSLARALRDPEFVKTTLLIGIPTKAILTGVTVFALPLLLARQSYVQEDIGQILMLYALGVLLSSSLVSRLVDGAWNTGRVLVIGGVGSGLGLILIGLAGSDAVTRGYPAGLTLMLVAGILVLGVSHGCINAPIVTHVATTPAADVLGPGATASLYRVLERIGHVAGPAVVGQILVVGHESLTALGWLGGGMIVLALLFVVRPSRPAASAEKMVLGART
ncbi:MAG TPA: MFS transporter [Chloroflexota bacterium]|nr:MFS transporter [Chloroflexota bacterium]